MTPPPSGRTSPLPPLSTPTSRPPRRSGIGTPTSKHAASPPATSGPTPKVRRTPGPSRTARWPSPAWASSGRSTTRRSASAGSCSVRSCGRTSRGRSVRWVYTQEELVAAVQDGACVIYDVGGEDPHRWVGRGRLVGALTVKLNEARAQRMASRSFERVTERATSPEWQF
uniref:Uncharacterized protein n=1 Tax=Arcella intermedia TaxID=1963864 RepID=A0A6B2LI53_9EUKA